VATGGDDWAAPGVPDQPRDERVGLGMSPGAGRGQKDSTILKMPV